MEQIPHGTKEYLLPWLPFRVYLQPVLVQGYLVPWMALEPIGDLLGVAIAATWADVGAAGDRVPSVVCPFDLGGSR